MGLQNVQLKAVQHLTQQTFRVQATVQSGADRPQLLYPRLDLGDHVLSRAGQELNEIAPGGGDALVQPHQHPQSAGRGDLLALHKIHRQIIGDFPGEQADGPHVRLFIAKVLNDRQSTLGPYRAPYVQLAGVLFHQLHMGVLHIAPDISAAVRHRQHQPQRPAPLDLQGERSVVLLEHVPQQGGRQQRPAQCGGGDWQKGMQGSGFFYQIPPCDGLGPDQTVGRDGSHHFIAHV